ncbi:polygalacturonase inhibitor 2-like [Vicia villosa]|uniref:polygalacturonase inhibitor 2-like n=1 Tax=Vicia villosa TaxID=3911 RepID=UPI00273C1441|nr:polygalacturonase inhibitor 2-like [Vicia villosa]
MHFSSCMFLVLLILTTHHFTPSLSEKCNPYDKTTLLQIKKQLGNPTKLSSWNPTTDCCDSWYGVSCDFNTWLYRVIHLALDNLNLPQPVQIPPAITNLPFLLFLSLNNNPNLVGPIPSTISNLTRLEYFFLSHTSISGEIPNTLSNNKRLISLDFSYSKLTGTLPATLPSLPKISGIIFSGNKLTGTIPESYGSFPKSFTVLNLSRNRLSGKIPASLAKLNLLFVELEQNMLEGDASVFFGSKKSTFKILLGKNSFAFDIGKVGLSKDLHALDLSNNKIYGFLPEGLTKLKFLNKLNVSNNNLCGQIPQGGKMQRFDESSYAHNKCLCGSPLLACKA